MSTVLETKTLHLLVTLCALIALLQNSHGANYRKRSGDVLQTNSTSAIYTPPTGTACRKVLANVTVDPPREGCLPGLMADVPMCSGQCNSYVQYTAASPHKTPHCMCCQTTKYRLSKRAVTFKCGNETESKSYNFAAVVDCACGQ